MTNEPVATTRDAKSLAKTKQKIAEVAALIRATNFPPSLDFRAGIATSSRCARRTSN